MSDNIFVYANISIVQFKDFLTKLESSNLIFNKDVMDSGHLKFLSEIDSQKQLRSIYFHLLDSDNSQSVEKGISFNLEIFPHYHISVKECSSRKYLISIRIDSYQKQFWGNCKRVLDICFECFSDSLLLDEEVLVQKESYKTVQNLKELELWYEEALKVYKVAS